MSMDEGDKAIVREIAYEAAGVIRKEFTLWMVTQIELHQSRCPLASTINRFNVDISGDRREKKGQLKVWHFIVGGLFALLSLLASVLQTIASLCK